MLLKETSYFMKTMNYRPRKLIKTKDEPLSQVFYMQRTVTPMQALESLWGQDKPSSSIKKLLQYIHTKTPTYRSDNLFLPLKSATTKAGDRKFGANRKIKSLVLSGAKCLLEVYSLVINKSIGTSGILQISVMGFYTFDLISLSLVSKKCC